MENTHFDNAAELLDRLVAGRRFDEMARMFSQMGPKEWAGVWTTDRQRLQDSDTGGTDKI